MRRRHSNFWLVLALLAAIPIAPSSAMAQPVKLTVQANTGNDTLYVGLPGAVVFSLEAPDTCVSAVNWWCEWNFTRQAALGNMRSPGNFIWSDSALAYFESRSVSRFVNFRSPDTTYVVAQDTNGGSWSGSGELFRYTVIPRDTATVDFDFQFTSGPPTWQTSVTPCGGTPMIPDVDVSPIRLAPCAAGNLAGGDVNFDRAVDSADIGYLERWLAGIGPAPVISNLADVNCDFAVDSTDLLLLDDYVLNGGVAPCDPCLTVAQNDPPETYIVFDTLETIQPSFASERVVRPRIYYSLPAPTATYSGITVRWSASDSLDYPADQPPFDYNWILFGPYPDQSSALPDSGFRLQTNDDPGTPQLEWDPDTSHTFFDLREGWYAFWIRARDDSLAADPAPAVARFRAVEPSFAKPFLLMDATNWRNGSLLNCGSYNFRDPRTDSLTPDTLQEWYKDLLEGHGYAFDRDSDFWARQVDTGYCPDCYRVLPNRDVLAGYKALILYDEDMLIPLDRDNTQREYERMLGEYLSVGGRLVMIGRNLFGDWVPVWVPTGAPQEAAFGPSDFPSRYFGVASMYIPGATFYALTVQADSADFSAATPIDPSFPPVAADTVQTLLLSQVPVPGIPDRSGDGMPNWLWVPDVNVVDVDTTRGAAGIYSFRSADSASSPTHGRVCGAHFEYFDSVVSDYTYKTALLTFPLSTLKRDGTPEALAGALLDYILGGFPTDVSDGVGGVRPEHASLGPNYPNPFNPRTTIRFETTATQHVNIRIYNVLGRRVSTLVDAVVPAGAHEVSWNGTDAWGRPVGSGVYFYSITAGDFSDSRKMLLLK